MYLIKFNWISAKKYDEGRSYVSAAVTKSRMWSKFRDFCVRNFQHWADIELSESIFHTE